MNSLTRSTGSGFLHDQDEKQYQAEYSKSEIVGGIKGAIVPNGRPRQDQLNHDNDTKPEDDNTPNITYVNVQKGGLNLPTWALVLAGMAAIGGGAWYILK